MSDDDWDTPPNNNVPTVNEDGCSFSSGRGFTSQRNQWSGNRENNKYGDRNGTSNYNSYDDAWNASKDSQNTYRDSKPRRHNDDRSDNRRFDRNSDRNRDGGFDGQKRSQFKSRNGDGNNDRKNDRNNDEPEKKKETYVPPERLNEEELFTSSITSGINFMKLSDVAVNVSGNNPPIPFNSFDESGLRPHLLDNVQKSGYTVPTPVQKYSIPAIMQNRDLMSCAQTGSGKTAAFLLPIIHHLITQGEPPNNTNNCAQPNAVIVSPTRELAIQIYEQAKKFSYNSIIKTVVTYGGTSTNHQRNRVLSGCHILVATPGRLKDFVNRRCVSFECVKYFVLDEADRMLDMGFLSDVETLLSNSSMPATGERITLMFSATFPEEIQELARKFLYDYIFLTVGIVGSACTDVEQIFVEVDRFKKRDTLLGILQENPNDRTLVFVETKRSTDFLASFLSEREINSTSIHGDRLQSEREEALYDFKSGRRKVLVATGVAARGLDIKGVTHVINYDLPKSIDEYVHRIGRTGRVGNRGKATSFYDEQQDRGIAQQLAKILGQANQVVPEWLGSKSSYGGESDTFGGYDVRKNDWNNGNSGNNVCNTVDDESWD